jgi:transcriptional regulator of heat shock response
MVSSRGILLLSMPDLSERQAQILKAIVEKYIETAESVGSETIEKGSSLGISPATIRNEMSTLTELGYLHQPHTSSGRQPTSMGLKFYINELMEEKQLSVAEEVAAKERIWDYRYEFDRLMREATRALAEKTRLIAIVGVDGGDVYSAGYANILEMPEFYDIDVTRGVLELLEQAKRLQNLFEKSFGEAQIHILLGDELHYEHLEPCGIIYTHFKAGSKSGVMGVIGSCRFHYPTVIPTLRYFGNLVSDVTKNW